MALIKLTQGKRAIVDRWHEAAGRPEWLGKGDDPTLLAEIGKFKWYAWRGRSSIWYAVTMVRLPDGRRGRFFLHQLVMGRAPGEATPGLMVDHIDRDGLNNRAGWRQVGGPPPNLRECTNSQNSANRKSAGGTSEFKGVHLYKNSAWRVHIQLDGRQKYLGLFSCGIERCPVCERNAAMVYDFHAVRGFGEYARPNFPEIDYLAMPEPPPKGRRKKPHAIEKGPEASASDPLVA